MGRRARIHPIVRPPITSEQFKSSQGLLVQIQQLIQFHHHYHKNDDETAIYL
jgi:hypothetical protein